MNQKEKIALQNCGLFQNIPEEAVLPLLTCLGAEEIRCEKNEIIWHVGDRIQSCAVILSGTLRAESVNASGQRALMAIHTAGSLVGDVLMSTPGEVSPVYVTAAEDCTLLFLPFRGIMGGCERNCPRHALLRENLISEIARKFWAQRRRIAYLSAHSLRQRIAMYLTDRSTQTGTTFSLGGTREDLADLLGVNRAALSRELSRMKKDGLIDFYRDTFRILEPENLAILSG